ncbi:MAG TPA: hypothetical protein VHZ51_27980 [Ktedonobacteraceae bacterium]|nr:hypothetical protein [Ktedonobacteraceae bacterium]
MKKAERNQKTTLVANLGDINRPLRVRPVRYLGREWWAVDGEDTWPGMVMDLRRLGFEAVAMGAEVLVREQPPAYEPMMDNLQGSEGLQPFPTINPKIRVRKESYLASYGDMTYLDEPEEMDIREDEDEWEPEEADTDEN